MTSQNSDCKRQKNLLQLPLPFYVSFILTSIADDTIPPNDSDALSETLFQSLSETMFQSLSETLSEARFPNSADPSIFETADFLPALLLTHIQNTHRHQRNFQSMYVTSAHLYSSSI